MTSNSRMYSIKILRSFFTIDYWLLAFALWANVHNLPSTVGHSTQSAQHCRPLRRFWSCVMGHSVVSASNQIRIESHVYPLLVYPCTSGCVSTCRTWLCAMCMWLCIHVNMDVYPCGQTMYTHACGHVSTCTWACIHMQMALYTRAEFLLWVMGHSAEFC